jgi:ribonuclease P protein component
VCLWAGTRPANRFAGVGDRLSFFFKKADRILKRSEFVELSDSGRKVHTEFFLALVAPGRTDRWRLGVTVSRRVGGAVQRTRIKRLVREFFRLHRHLLKGQFDINVIAKPAVADRPNSAVYLALQELFEKVSRQIDR